MERLTLVEQPVSSLARVNFGENYGHLMCYLAERYRIPEDVVMQAVDNHLVHSPLYFSEYRQDLLSFRKWITSSPPSLEHPGFL